MKTKIPQVLQGWSVVVADDEEDSLVVATMLLEMAGADVRQARNGREALGLIRQLRPHFVLSDLSMPEMDGWLLMHELNTDRSTIDLPVIALTAHAMNGDRERAIEAGFTNYITKPLDPEKFLGQLLNLLVAVPELEALLQVVN
jgi:CheY-like chemotaxis protein